MFYLRAIIIFISLFSLPLQALDVVSYPASTKSDSYTVKLLIMALENSRDKYGDYKVEFTPGMSIARSLSTLEKDRYINFVRVLPPSPQVSMISNIDFVPFPVRLGILGYRVCAVSEGIRHQVYETKNLAGLRKLSHVQGANWPDLEILRYNQIPVTGVGKSEFDTRRSVMNMYKMLSNGEADIFCRAAYEVLREEPLYHGLNVTIDQDMLLYYPFPFFFYVNNNNKRIIDRLQYGLEKSYSQGEVFGLWDKYYGSMLNGLNLSSRTLIVLNNEWVKDISKEYERFVFRPRE